MLLLLRGPSVQAAPPTSPVLTNLLRFYKYDDGSGDVLTDYSANAQHGQLGSTAGADANDPAWVTEGLDFITDDYVDLPLAAFAGQFTISVVFKPEAAATMTIVGGATGTQGILSQATSILVRVITASATFTHTQPLDAWEMVTVTRNADNLIDLYVNDGPANRLTFSPAAQAGDALLDILGRRLASSAPMNGKQAGALFYDRAITETENAENFAYWQAELAGRGIAL